ncbi:zinc finger, CCHC-type containing protein [Tanacetum coccineum]
MAPYTPQQNGVAERKIRSLKEMVNSMLSYSGLSDGFWGEAIAVVRLPDPKRKTLGEKGIDCIFVEYNQEMQSLMRIVSLQYLDQKNIIPNSDESQRDDHSNDVPSDTLEPHRGFRQKEGIDYFDTYVPVARITTIRLLLALVVIHNLVIHQMDVKTSFLNGDFEEELYMKQPEGFVMPDNEHKVYKLVKSLYRLKQAPKQ